MDFLFITQFFPVIMTVVGTLKRFVPNEKRDIVNPIVAAVTGMMGAYTFGGQQEVINLLLEGLTAAVVAIGAYKIPKLIGQEILKIK